MQEQASKVSSPSIQIGRVVSPSPLVVQIGDLQVDRDNILIAEHQLQSGVRAGDEVAVMPTADRQIYIVLVKVVSP